MKVVTVLMGAGCASGPLAVDRVRAVLSELNVQAHVDEIVVTSHAQAVEQQYLGSPTVRVEGQDIDPRARGLRSFGMT